MKLRCFSKYGKAHRVGWEWGLIGRFQEVQSVFVCLLVSDCRTFLAALFISDFRTVLVGHGRQWCGPWLAMVGRTTNQTSHEANSKHAKQETKNQATHEQTNKQACNDMDGMDGWVG